MILCKDLDKSFETKEELFRELKENKDELIYLKKSKILKSVDKNASVSLRVLDPSKLQSQNKNIKIDKDHYYVAVNTTKVLDSHSDVHLNGIWNKTVKEQQGKNYLVLDHDLSIKSVVVRKEDIEMFVVDIPFKMIGKDYQGNTQALIYKFRKSKIINDLAKNWLKEGNDIEASVRMQYVKVELALNSDDDDDVKEKEIYDRYYKDIANKDEFKEILFFWAVSEAKNIRESSLVLAGSNSATGIIQDSESSKDTQKEEAAKALQRKQEYLLKLN